MKIDMIVSQEKETVEAHEQRQMRNEMTTGVGLLFFFEIFFFSNIHE